MAEERKKGWHDGTAMLLLRNIYCNFERMNYRTGGEGEKTFKAENISACAPLPLRAMHHTQTLVQFRPGMQPCRQWVRQGLARITRFISAGSGVNGGSCLSRCLHWLQGITPRAIEETDPTRLPLSGLLHADAGCMPN
jgi:hypothetical protein